MVCPNCNKSITPINQQCPNCSAYIQNSIELNNTITSLSANPQPPKLTFNTVFSVFIIITYGKYTFNVFNLFQASSLSMFMITIALLGIGILAISTGVLLLQRKRLGYILQYFINIFGIITYLIFFLLSILLIVLMSHEPTEIDRITNIILNIAGIAIALISIPEIVLHTFTLIYYKKRKQYFNK